MGLFGGVQAPESSCQGRRDLQQRAPGVLRHPYDLISTSGSLLLEPTVNLLPRLPRALRPLARYFRYHLGWFGDDWQWLRFSWERRFKNGCPFPPNDPRRQVLRKPTCKLKLRPPDSTHHPIGLQVENSDFILYPEGHLISPRLSKSFLTTKSSLTTSLAPLQSHHLRVSRRNQFLAHKFLASLARPGSRTFLLKRGQHLHFILKAHSSPPSPS